jgi:etoposide-induced 2.4 mRNA
MNDIQSYFIDTISQSVAWIYHILWLYPIYTLSFVLNSMWYQDIADQAFVVGGLVQPKKQMGWAQLIQLLASEIVRAVVLLVFVLQNALCSFVPFIGKYIAFIHLCWLYSLYSFEYKWAALAWSNEKRVEFFETRALYFFGFGIPAAGITIIFPAFINSGVFALIFPVFIMLAMQAPADGIQQWTRVPVFRLPTKLSSTLLSLFGSRAVTPQPRTGGN